VIPYNKNLKETAKELRNKQTEAERFLWQRLRLRHLGCTFYRQKPLGQYIVDFYCPKARLIIEVDGGRHFTSETAANDRVRDDFLRSVVLSVLRFSNSEILSNIDNVTENIHKNLRKILLNPPFSKGDKTTIKKSD